MDLHSCKSVLEYSLHYQKKNTAVCVSVQAYQPSCEGSSAPPAAIDPEALKPATMGQIQSELSVRAQSLLRVLSRLIVTAASHRVARALAGDRLLTFLVLRLFIYRDTGPVGTANRTGSFLSFISLRWVSRAGFKVQAAFKVHSHSHRVARALAGDRPVFKIFAFT
jgi:hypothetical protein